jgi:hypothetical protein
LDHCRRIRGTLVAHGRHRLTARLTFCSGDAFDDGAQVLARTRPSGIRAVVVTSAAGVMGLRAAKPELPRAVAVMVGCRNVLTIGLGMSRLQHTARRGRWTPNVGGPERSEVQYPISLGGV